MHFQILWIRITRGTVLFPGLSGGFPSLLTEREVCGQRRSPLTSFSVAGMENSPHPKWWIMKDFARKGGVVLSKLAMPLTNPTDVVIMEAVTQNTETYNCIL